MRSIRSEIVDAPASAGKRLLTAALLLLAPAGAAAQTYSASLEPMPYEALPLSPGGPVQNLLGTVQGYGWAPIQATIALPFPVEFFGQAYSSINVLGIGMVTFGNVYTSTPTSGYLDLIGQRAIPDTDPATPHNFVAVWWDKITCESAGLFKSQVVGTAPDRHYVLQWTDCRRYSSLPVSKMNAQLWLPESGGDIEVRYGAILDNATNPAHVFRGSMGIENEDGTDGAPGLSIDGTVCNPDCVASDFPTGHRIVYRVATNVSIGSVRSDPNPITTGYPATFHAQVTNRTAQDLHDAAVRFRVAPGPAVAGAEEIGTVTGLSVPAGASVDVPLAVDTTGWTTGAIYVFAELDPDGEILPEPIPPAVAGPFVVKEPTAELRIVGGLQAPRWVEQGAIFDVEWDVENRDLLDAEDAGYTLLLSEDPAFAGTNNFVLATGAFSLASFERISLAQEVTLTPTLNKGVYWIGVFLDPRHEIPHADRSGTFAAVRITVGLELEIATTDLPGGRVGVPYAADVVAKGGDGDYAWSVSSGALPRGLSIDQVAGACRIAGFPEAIGVFSFSLEVRSDRFVQTADFSIEILRAPVSPLEIATYETLPAATIGQPYSLTFASRGGVPPYSWSTAGPLPPGLSVSGSGRLEGTPNPDATDGSYSFNVTVTDAESVEATRLFVLRVDPAPLACAEGSNLPTMPVGVAIDPIRLVAGGGLPPYAWKSESGAVPGLELSADGVIAGTPSKTGRWSWAVAVSDTRAKQSICRVRFEVGDGGLRITSDVLPQALAGEAYETRLEAIGASGTLTWTLGSEAGLPEGLALSADGLIRGVPAAAALGGEASRTFHFQVTARDSAQREASAAMSLKVVDPRPAGPRVVRSGKKGGCQSTSGDTSLLALGVALGLAGLVRRRV